MNNIFKTLNISAEVNGVAFEVYSHSPNIQKNEVIVDPLMHRHFSEEFFYIFDGSIRLALQDSSCDILLKKGDLCLIPAGMYHCAFSDSAERLCFGCRFETDRKCTNGTNVKYQRINRSLKALKQPFVITSPYVDMMMERYRELSVMDGCDFYAEMATTLISVSMFAFDFLRTNEINTQPISPEEAENDERRRIIERFITEFFGDKCCLSMLSKALCLSERRTSTVIRDIMGKSFKELIVEERMRVADMLVKTGKYPLEEIAEIVGYSSYSGFYTAWFGFYGHSPTEHI